VSKEASKKAPARRGRRSAEAQAPACPEAAGKEEKKAAARQTRAAAQKDGDGEEEETWNCSQSTICEEDLLENTVKPQLVYFDIETTGLAYSREIVQVACYEPGFEDSFSVYMLPRGGFEPGASRVTGLTKEGGALLYRGKRVETVSLKEGLSALIEWLRFLQPVLLVGHNARCFDSTRLVLAMHGAGLLEAFSATLLGFADSLPVIRDMFPGRDNYRLQSLVAEWCPEEDWASHEALGDAMALQRVLAELEAATLRNSAQLLLARLFTCDEVLGRLVAMGRV